MAIDRRRFLTKSGAVAAQLAAVGAGLPGCAGPTAESPGRGAGPAPGAAAEASMESGSPRSRGWASGHPFQHGVASGDPLSDRVILWTRVSPAASELGAVLAVRWWVASDPGGRHRVAEGDAKATPDRDYTVKVDAAGLAPGTSYFYGFESGDPKSRAGRYRSPLGRTRTLSASGVAPIRFATVSCANYPEGFFNAYAALAQADDLDFVVHLGDYLYEHANGQYGDGTKIDRIPEPNHEIVSLDDYRARHSTYKRDLDLQAAHARHPWIAVWDDHESANNSSYYGAQNHQPETEGDWAPRRLAAIRAYQEWMPIRELPTGLFRRFALGDLAELIMLDARLEGRDALVDRLDHVGAQDPARSILGFEQERRLEAALREAQASGRRWKILGQQSPFSPLTEGEGPFNPDTWDGYRASRKRVLDQIRLEELEGMVILSGDFHSSWAFEVPAPLDESLPSAASGKPSSFAVEFVAPAVSSPPLGSSDRMRQRMEGALERHPHLRFLDVTRNGFLRIDLDEDRVRAEWVYTGDRRKRSAETFCGAAFESLHGTNRLRRVELAGCEG